MEIKPIKTRSDHRTALKEIETLMTARPGTPEGERLDVLVTLVEAWEKKRFPINRVYEVLTRKRPLTLQMIRRLNRDLGIPAESLIKPSNERRAA